MLTARENIDAMARGVYRDPSVVGPLSDLILETTGETWTQWLESSGRLKGISRHMVATIDSWARVPEIAGHATGRYVTECHAFRVPPVMVEVGHVIEVEAHEGLMNDWLPPSLGFATYVLSGSLRCGADKFWGAPGFQWDAFRILIHRARQAYHPRENGCRIRLGYGDWQEIVA